MCNIVKHFLISTLISIERMLMIFNKNAYIFIIFLNASKKKKWQWLKWFRLLLKFNSLLQVYTYVLCAIETCVSVLMWSFQYCLESKLKYFFHVHNHHLNAWWTMKNVLSATYGSCKYILYSIYIFIVICPVYFFFIAHLLIFNKKTRNFGVNYRTDTELSRTIVTGCH